MNLAEHKMFLGYLALQLALVGGGTQVVSDWSRQAQAQGQKNREAERYVRDEAIDADSVREREQIVQRLQRRLEDLERIFEYQLDRSDPARDPLLVVQPEAGGTADPNRFQDAIRAARDDLKRTGLRFPDGLGFGAEQPTAELLRLRVWQLDMIRYLLRQAQQAGVEEIPENGIKLPKKQLVDPQNFLEFAQVEITFIGSSESLARVLHACLLPGKYFSVEDASFGTGKPDKRNEERVARSQLVVRVAAQAFNLTAPVTRVDPDAPAPGAAPAGPTFYEFGRR